MNYNKNHDKKQRRRVESRAGGRTTETGMIKAGHLKRCPRLPFPDTSHTNNTVKIEQHIFLAVKYP